MPKDYDWSEMSLYDKNKLVEQKIMDSCGDVTYGMSNYTQDLNSAFQIVEKLGLTHKFKCYMTICDGKPNGWEVEFGKYRVYARTLPLAICLCAFQAKDIKV